MRKHFGAGKARVVIASGGTINWLGSEEPEAVPMSMLLQEWGVPKGRIILETRSQNTRQNVVNSKKIIAARGLESGLLVTSALHMPRALKTFRMARVPVLPAPTDFSVVDRKGLSLWGLLPQAGGLGGTTVALKEAIGLVYY